MLDTFTITIRRNEKGEVEEILWSGTINPEMTSAILPQIVAGEARKKALMEFQKQQPKQPKGKRDKEVPKIP